MTFAELDRIATRRRLEDWDRVAFLTEAVVNSNPSLIKYIKINNPFRRDEEEADALPRVPLELVPFD